MVRPSEMQSWRGYMVGQRVRMLIETRGATADDEEIAHPSGTLATITHLADFGKSQGKGVDVIIGEGDDAICNSFDDQDVKALGGVPFTRI
jgi:hypothetical protein